MDIEKGALVDVECIRQALASYPPALLDAVIAGDGDLPEKSLSPEVDAADADTFRLIALSCIDTVPEAGDVDAALDVLSAGPDGSAIDRNSQLGEPSTTTRDYQPAQPTS